MSEKLSIQKKDFNDIESAPMNMGPSSAKEEILRKSKNLRLRLRNMTIKKLPTVVC